jgi:phosphoribosylformimino-5-aminoimidazole carboxamide ribotide isomerase
VPFTVYPAIDLRGGEVVRLRQGDPAAQATYGSDPAAIARRWAEQGALWLHVVNLDGALEQEQGSPNLERLAEIHAAVPLPIQFGGGIRSLADVTRALDLGARRVVLGTVAVEQPAVVRQAIERFGADRIVVGIDARSGEVAVRGWQQTAPIAAGDLAAQMRLLGVRRVVYTDIARDGMLSGANVAATVALAEAGGLPVIASGGVAGEDDIRALAAHWPRVEGVIVGQALYSGALDLPAALAAALAAAAGAGRGE